MQAVRVVGQRGAGKTTVIEHLASALAGDARVGSIKSIHHDIDVDDPGTDTDRHRVAGACPVTGITPSASFTVRTAETTGRGSRLVAALERFADDGVDYALLEGFGTTRVPAIAVGSAPEATDPIVAQLPRRPAVDTAVLVETIDDLRPFHTPTSFVPTIDGEGIVAVAAVDTPAGRTPSWDEPREEPSALATRLEGGDDLVATHELTVPAVTAAGHPRRLIGVQATAMSGLDAAIEAVGGRATQWTVHDRRGSRTD